MPTPAVLAGRYRLVEPIARGGVGHVWLAVDENLGREVAVKVVDLAASPDPAAAARFERELRTAAGLAHPNVVRVYDGGLDGERAYLVMELLAGPSLASLVAEGGALMVDEALRYAQQICRGLAAAHDAGIVHRDVKPSNLVLGDDLAVRLVDFGIARLLSSTDDLTQMNLTATGTVLGTAAYIAPEQASAGSVDARADLYALGCVIFYLLTAAPPYEADTPVAVAAQHLHAPLPSLRDRRPDAPGALDGLVRDLLAKEPGRRPQTARDVLARIDPIRGMPTAEAATLRLEAAHPTEPIPVAPPPPPPEPGRRRARPIAAAVFVALLLIALGLTLADRGSGSGPRRAGAAPSAKPIPSTSTPTTTATTAAPTTSSPPTTSAPPSPAQAAADLAASLQQAAASGDLQARPASDLAKQISDLQNAVAAGKPGKVGHMVADLAKRLDALVNGGQLTSAGRSLFDAPLTALEQAFPSSQPGGSDQQGGGD